MFIIAKQIALHMSHCREQKDVMHVKFTYVFVLDRNFEILILSTRKKENWKTKEEMEGTAVTLETERANGPNP